MSDFQSKILVHPDRVKIAQDKIQTTNVGDLTSFFRLLSGETRIKILVALSEGEMCNCDLSDALGMSVSAISHQLKVLREGRLVKFRREVNDKHRYYSLEIEHLEPIITSALDHLQEVNSS